MAVLVTGGAGYIGSHTCVELLENNKEVVVLDNLSNSSEEALNRVKRITGKEVKFYKGDISDIVILDTIFKKENIESCWPGGKFLQVHIEYDTVKAVFTYFGRYGLQFSVPKDTLTHVVVKEVSRTHSVLQLYSGEDCVGTSDLLPTEACNTMKDWMLQY